MPNLVYTVMCVVTCMQLTHAQVSFLNSSAERGIDHYYQSPIFMGGGTAFFDLNQDGWDDLWMNGGSIRDKMFLNNGDGSFTDISTSIGMDGFDVLGSTCVITGDINNDGHREVLVGTGNSKPNQLLFNNGDGTFSDITISSGLALDTAWTTSASFADINLDGYLDIFVGNYIETPRLLVDGQGLPIGFDHDCFTDFLYLNNGDNTFTRLGDSYWDASRGCVLASTFTDYDMDGDPDLMIANDFGEWIIPNRLFRNDYPEASLVELSSDIGADPQLYGMGIAVADYDLDQDLDYYITNLGRNVLLNNDGNVFYDVTAEAQVEDVLYQDLNTVGWGTSFEDLNLDMYPDLIVINGYIEALDFIETNPKNPNKLYINDTAGGFIDISGESGFFDTRIGRGLACSDVDNDGDIDLMVMNINGLVLPGQEDKVVLYDNKLESDQNWLKISLQGTKNNADAFGSIVRCYVGGKTLIRELNGGSSHASQNSSVLHFGLAGHEQVDSISITWPGGAVQTMVDLEVKTRYHILEDPTLYTNVTDEPEIVETMVYPIPARNQLFIKNGSSDMTYRIYDYLGKMIIVGQDMNIDISSLTPGQYTIEVLQSEQRVLRRFIKL